MTGLKAVKLSSAVAGVLLGPSFVGFVHSVQDHCVCLVSSHLFAISIEWDDLGKSANGVTVKRPDDVITFTALGIAKGTECRRTGNVLGFVGCDCSVLLENVEPWNPKMITFTSHNDYADYKGNVEFLLNCLSIKCKNEAMENVGLGPVVLLANSGDQEHLTKCVQQEWRFYLLRHLYSLILCYRRADIQKAINAAVKIFEIGEITHNFLIGLCASFCAFGVEGTSLFKTGITDIIQKTRKKVFISEAEVILAFQGDFSEKMHSITRTVVQGGEDVLTLINSLDNYTTGCILGICVGVNMICSENDTWIEGITAYLKSEKSENSAENVNTENAETDNSFIPRIFKQGSWRRMLNL